MFSRESPVSIGCERSHSKVQRPTTTFLRGRVSLGGFLVYWYASVSTSAYGNSFSTASAMAFTNLSMVPAVDSSSSSTAAHLGHVQ